jgi:hypothetical protein
MANSLTYKGEEATLKSPTSLGSIARIAEAIRLFKGDSTPAKDGSGFNEVPTGNGYTAGGHAITEANWTYAATNSKVTLVDQVWTAGGGSIENVRGAYIVDGSGNVLAWWELSGAITLASGDQLELDDLAVRFV